MIGSSAKDIIPIDPTILKEDNMHKKNEDKNITHGSPSSLYPTSPTSPALHGHAQIIKNSTPISNTNLDTQQLPSKKQLSNKINCNTPYKQYRKDLLLPEDQQYTLYSYFSATPLHK